MSKFMNSKKVVKSDEMLKNYMTLLNVHLAIALSTPAFMYTSG